MTSPTQSETWERFEAEVREDMRARLAVEEVTPLEFGAAIAWSRNSRGKTDEFTPVHRIGFPQIDRAFTACGELVPAPILWLPLSPAMIRTMDKCRYCEAEMARISREQAA